MKKLTPLFLAAMLIVSGCSGTGTSGDAQMVKIGVITPLTGDVAAYGQQVQYVLDYAIDKVNQTYQDSGYQFELVYEDGQCGSAAATAFQKLADVEDVSYVLGGLCSSESMAIAPLLEEKGVVAVSGWSSNPELEGMSSNFFSLSYSDSSVSDGIASELSKYKKVAILTEQNDYNVGLHDSVVAVLGEGVEVVADETVLKGATDFRNTLQKIKAAEPEVVFFNSNPGVTSETLAKQLAELTDWEVAKVAGFGMLVDSYIALSPQTFANMVVVDTPKVDSDEFNAMKEAVLAANTGATLDDLGAFYTATTYDALTTLVEAIVVGENVSADVVAALQSDSFDGYIGTIQFGDSTFVKGISTALYKAQDGVWIQK